jgi:hypothetical protein
MESSRSQGRVVILLQCQTHDPAKGSFMVHPMAVKTKSGNTKRVPNPSYDKYDPDSEKGLPVFRSCHHIKGTRKGVSQEAHPEAFDFAVDYRR